MLVTVKDLTTYMDVKFSNRQEDAAGMVLAGLQSELESILRRPLEVQEFDEIYVIESQFVALPDTSFFDSVSLARNLDSYVYVGPTYTLPLAHSPVVSVSTVEIVGPEMVTPLVLQEERDYLVRKFGIEFYNVAANDMIHIVYDAGLDGEAIPVFKLLILRAATREMQNMHDDVVGVKDLAPRNVAPMVTGFTQDEIASVKRWRRVRVA